MSEDKYEAQKKHLATKKNLRVWVNLEIYEQFKNKVEQNGTSIYAVINDFIRKYINE